MGKYFLSLLLAFSSALKAQIPPNSGAQTFILHFPNNPQIIEKVTPLLGQMNMTEAFVVEGRESYYTLVLIVFKEKINSSLIDKLGNLQGVSLNSLAYSCSFTIVDKIKKPMQRISKKPEAKHSKKLKN